MPQKSKQSIFRETALNKAFAKDDLDKLMQVTRPTGWLALLVLAVIICAFLVWGALGNISIRVSATGIILQDSTGNENAAIFLPLAEKDRVKTAMPVRISPAGFPPQEYGYLMGKVRSVGRYPLTERELMEILGTESLVGLFSGGGPLVVVNVDLERDAETGNYVWTAAKNVPISIGILLQAGIITDNKRPLALILPR